MSNTMCRSKINYRGVGADGRPIDWMYSWNPGGFGCSMNCPGCWAHDMPFKGRGNGTGKCEKCQRFEVHLHPERLDQPLNTKKPGVVLCNFTSDTFDEKRSESNIHDILVIVSEPHTSQHQFVFLTKNAARCKTMIANFPRIPPNWSIGLTLRNQFDTDQKLSTFLAIRGNLWLSLEPLWGPIMFDGVALLLGDLRRRPMTQSIKGVVIGHDNQRGAPGTDTLDYIRSAVKQCQEARIPVFIKQVWMMKCARCEKHVEPMALGMGCDCRNPVWRHVLVKDPAFFPADLRLRNLPWSAA